jgi:hypothetical protein
LLRVQVRVETVQAQPVPESAVIVRPGGGVSVTVTVPLGDELPTLSTVTVYVTVCPAAAMLGLCSFAIVRSLAPAGGGSIATPAVSKDPSSV